ncbi:MAG: nucleotidyl transferase AbiEii/AbiGii toxin family protein [Planctomycetota bacterium]|jgi:hypothetical protein
MDKVATMSGDARADLFRETSTQVGLPPALIEKDFWVCWTLKQLFCIEALRDNILFKGGTSLSKILNAIHRFSEDIDLAISFEMLGFTGSKHPGAAPSRNKRQKILDEMLTACCGYVAGEFLQLLVDCIASALGPAGPWELRARPIGKSSVVAEFAYPACLEATEHIGYIKPMVVLEPGTHAEFIPRGTYTTSLLQRSSFRMCSRYPRVRSMRLLRSERSGRRLTFCTPSTIGRPTSPC